MRQRDGDEAGAGCEQGRVEAREAHDRLAREFLAAELTADEVLARYCTLVYARTGSYLAAATTLGIDRRTVKNRVDEALLRELKT